MKPGSAIGSVYATSFPGSIMHKLTSLTKPEEKHPGAKTTERCNLVEVLGAS